MWVAGVTEAANNHSLFPHRDNTASRVRADAVRRRKKAAKQLSKMALSKCQSKQREAKQPVVVARPRSWEGINCTRQAQGRGVDGGASYASKELPHGARW